MGSHTAPQHIGERMLQTQTTAAPFRTVVGSAEIDKSKRKKLDLKSMRDRDREQVRGIFRFYECEGGLLQFIFKKYKEDELESYSLQDGAIYTLPLGVAKHLNQNGWYPEYHYAPSIDGPPLAKIKHKIRRFGFQSLEFLDNHELDALGNPDLVQVESVSPEFEKKLKQG